MCCLLPPMSDHTPSCFHHLEALIAGGCNHRAKVLFFCVSWYFDVLLIHSLVSMETLKRDPFPPYNLMGQNFLKMITFSKFDAVACSKSLPGPDSSLVPCKVISMVQ